MINKDSYKVVLFDKECENLVLPELAELVKKTGSSRGLVTSLILVSDSSSAKNSEDATYSHEIINNVMNKDLLRLLFEKFI